MREGVKHRFRKNSCLRIYMQSKVCSISCYILNQKNACKVLYRLWLSVFNWEYVHENQKLQFERRKGNEKLNKKW